MGESYLNTVDTNHPVEVGFTLFEVCEQGHTTLQFFQFGLIYFPESGIPERADEGIFCYTFMQRHFFEIANTTPESPFFAMLDAPRNK